MQAPERTEDIGTVEIWVLEPNMYVFKNQHESPVMTCETIHQSSETEGNSHRVLQG
jgi:hypothetical protein